MNSKAFEKPRTIGARTIRQDDVAPGVPTAAVEQGSWIYSEAVERPASRVPAWKPRRILLIVVMNE
jgi:hypothetical protein